MPDASAQAAKVQDHDRKHSTGAPYPLSDPTLAAVGCGIPVKPIVDHTSLPPELWLDIFRFATHVSRTRSIAPRDPLTPERPVDYAWGMNSPIQSMRTKRALVHVCRAWRMMATELLYEHVVLSSVRRFERFCRTLLESRKERTAIVDGTLEGPGNGYWVRHLEVQRWARSSRSRAYWQCIVRAVSFCQRMRVFSGLWQEPLPEGFLPVLVQYLPSTLEELYWQQDSVLIAGKELPILTTPAFVKFPALRVLDLSRICILDAERSLQHVTFDSITLPHVTALALPTCPFLLRYASKQVMPALRHLILDAAGAPRTVYAPLVTKELMNFLDSHGDNITTVELLPSNTHAQRPGPICISAFLAPSACPNLDTLVFDCHERVPAASLDSLIQHSERPTPGAAGPTLVNLPYFGAGPPALPPLTAPHPTLRRVGLRGVGTSKLYPNKPAQAQAHLEALLAYRVLLPALEVVRTPGFLVGTSTDAYAPDVFIWWTERFERVGVDMQDGEGVVWMVEEEPQAKKATLGGGPEEGGRAALGPPRPQSQAQAQTLAGPGVVGGVPAALRRAGSRSAVEVFTGA